MEYGGDRSLFMVQAELEVVGSMRGSGPSLSLCGFALTTALCKIYNLLAPLRGLSAFSLSEARQNPTRLGNITFYDLGHGSQQIS